MAWAYAEGIAKGVSSKLFAPDADVTREQMVTFFARYAAVIGEDTTANGDLSAFADSGDVSAFARNAMIWAVENGLIQGVDANTLSPRGCATRVQAAAMLVRFAENIS